MAEQEMLEATLELAHPGREHVGFLDHVLVRNSKYDCWRLAQFTHFEDDCIAVLGGNVFVFWKPFHNNRRLLGTTEPEWHRDFRFSVGDKVRLFNGVAEGRVAIVFEDEEFESHPYRVNWDNGTFGFYGDDELDPIDEDMSPAPVEANEVLPQEA